MLRYFSGVAHAVGFRFGYTGFRTFVFGTLLRSLRMLLYGLVCLAFGTLLRFCVGLVTCRISKLIASHAFASRTGFAQRMVLISHPGVVKQSPSHAVGSVSFCPWTTAEVISGGGDLHAAVFVVSGVCVFSP